jgi:hypothetical protein
MSYPTVTRIVALVLVAGVVASLGPASAEIMVSPKKPSWSEQAPDWLLTLLLKRSRKPRSGRPGSPPGTQGEEGPGTCPSGFVGGPTYTGPGHC